MWPHHDKLTILLLRFRFRLIIQYPSGNVSTRILPHGPRVATDPATDPDPRPHHAPLLPAPPAPPAPPSLTPLPAHTRPLCHPTLRPPHRRPAQPDDVPRPFLVCTPTTPTQARHLRPGQAVRLHTLPHRFDTSMAQIGRILRVPRRHGNRSGVEILHLPGMREPSRVLLRQRAERKGLRGRGLRVGAHVVTDSVLSSFSSPFPVLRSPFPVLRSPLEPSDDLFCCPQRFWFLPAHTRSSWCHHRQRLFRARDR